MFVSSKRAVTFGNNFAQAAQNSCAMKPIMILLTSVILLSGCASTSTLLRQGRYDEAIVKTVHKLKKTPDKTKQVDILAQSFKLANDRDLERISFLKKTGQPEIWEEVFSLYSRLKSRQDLVKTAPPAVLSAIGFVPHDYDNDVIEAKRKAAEYFYAHALDLLSKNDKYLAREAWEDLMKVKGYYPSYRDTENLLDKAYAMGVTHVLFKMNNAAPVVLPAGFEEELLKIALRDLDTRWVHFDVREVQDRNYDNFVLLNLRAIDVSPERVREREWEESRTVEDGWKYVYDANGNVMKDSAGNDIKEKKYKTITCRAIETTLSKSAIVSGVLDFYDNQTKQLLRSEPITAQSDFNHMYVTAVGDFDALTPETRKKLGRPIPFPNDLEMIMRTNDILKDIAKNLIHNNMHLFR